MERTTQYNIERRFVEGSRLHTYLSFKEPEMISLWKRDYTLFTVLTALRSVISREKLYDRRNTTCLIASTELEWALGMKFLHICEVKSVVLTQMVPNESSLILPSNSANNQQQHNGNKPPFDVEALYLVKPAFLKVLQQVPGVTQNTNIFKYREICSILSQYILSNKDKFFDNRNVKIALVANDDLGVAFNVDIFHRAQVTTLIRKQLVPASWMRLRNGKIVRR